MSMDHGTLEFYSRVITILVAVNVCMLSYCIDGMCAWQSNIQLKYLFSLFCPQSQTFDD